MSEHAESIAFHQGEVREENLINSKLNLVTSTMQGLARAKARLSFVAWGHGWLVTLTSVAIASPGYLQHKLDFGGIMVVVGAFSQVQSSMRWFVANYGNIADWRSLVNRLYAFDQLIDDQIKEKASADGVASEQHDDMAVRDLGIQTSLGHAIVEGISFTIAEGDRILLGGESGSGKSSILRAVSGLWPWLTGSVKLPKICKPAFLPQKPYFPHANLSEALSYPAQQNEFSKAEYEKALDRVNLSELKSRLEEVNRWDHVLSLGQQQRLSFARMLLKRPKWVFMDESTSALDDENEKRMMQIFDQELKGATVFSVGHRASLAAYHSRIMNLKKGFNISEAGMDQPSELKSNILLFKPIEGTLA